MAASLYRKYRPQRFSELVGQEHVGKALQNALCEGRLAHAYLFSGTRGTGKTSTARILGAVLNCQAFKSGFPKESIDVEPCGECESCIASRAGNSFDVIELDAASNNGVDDMRELIEKVSYSTASGGKKVYIIDEVHELTGRAANALLKTLEEPPEHVVFILATTNPEKVLPTIRSRTQHFEFQIVDEKKLFDLAKEVLSWEERTLDDEALMFVARKGAGSVRDMLSYLDQVLALEVTTLEELQAAHASDDSPRILELIVAASSGDVGETLSTLHDLAVSGKEPRAIVENIISVARDCLVVSLNPQATILLSNVADKDQLGNVGEKCGTNFLRQFILKLGKAVADMRGTASLSPLLNVEVALLSTIQHTESQSRTISGSVSTGVANRSPRNDSVAIPETKSSSKELQSEVPGIKISPPTTKGVPGTDSILGSALRDCSKKDESAVESSIKPDSKGTLGSLKKSAKTEVLDATDPDANKVKVFQIEDVVASWPKVIELLSVASRDSIKKATPVKLEGDVLTFSVHPSELDEVKERFKKDATIIRGFLNSIHETSFRFRIVEEEDNNDKTLEESQEFDPVDNVVSMFSGEVVPE